MIVIPTHNVLLEAVYDPDAHYEQLLAKVATAEQNEAIWSPVVSSLKKLFVIVSKAIGKDASKRIEQKWSEDPEVIMNLASLAQFSSATGGDSLNDIVGEIHANWPSGKEGFNLELEKFKDFPDVIVTTPGARPKRKGDMIANKRRANLEKVNEFLAPFRKPFEIARRALHKAQHDIRTAQEHVDNFDTSDGAFTSNLSQEKISEPEYEHTSQLVSINDLPELQWFLWPADIDVASNSKFKSGKQGEGGGESWSAYVFGGKVQGQSSLFDLALPSDDGFQKWEVKEYDTSSKEPIIRLGSHGTSATADILERLSGVFRQLKSFTKIYKEMKLDELTQEYPFAAKFVNSLEEYLPRAQSKLIVHGQITNVDLEYLGKAIRAAKKVYDDVTRRIKVPTLELSVNGKQLTLDGDDYVKLLYKLHSMKMLPEELGNEEILCAAVAELNDPVFRGAESYREMLSKLFNALTPQVAFNNVDGLLLVSPRAFVKIPRSSLNDILEYTSMSENRRPNFKISLKFPKPESAIQIPMTPTPAASNDASVDFPPFNAVGITQ
jgi:hypothetical protein